MTTSDQQFSYDEDLLHAGRYRDWFWQGLQEDQLAFLRAPVKVPAPPPAEPIYKNQEFKQPRDWRNNAVCRDTDPVVFFGKEGADLRKQYMNPRAKWRRLCPQCPVRSLCLELARESVSEGIFGGKLFQFHQATKDGILESRNTLHEYDDETMPRKGRPKGSRNKPKKSYAGECCRSEPDVAGDATGDQ